MDERDAEILGELIRGIESELARSRARDAAIGDQLAKSDITIARAQSTLARLRREREARMERLRAIVVPDHAAE